jgi:hypothetical protein
MTTGREICIETDCSKSKQTKLGNFLIIPFEGGTAEIQKLFSYFLYSVPDVESTHSHQIPKAKHSSIFDMMMKKRHFRYQKFCSSQAHIEKELSKGYLNGDAICLKCKRFVCKKKQARDGIPPETDLDCFLRHIRNAIAHGRVYCNHAGNRIHIVFEDKNSTGKLSARIVCIKADLELWKRILSKPENYQ